MEPLPEGPLTILFSDVEGSTDLRTTRGDTAAQRILQAHEAIIRACVADHDGWEVKALGDGFMVAFASARKALACAQEIQQRLGEHNRVSLGDEVHVRIGINTGEVIVEGDDLFGQAVNAAARIAARARGGEILVSDVVRRVVGTGPEFPFLDRGRCRLKGFPDRWHLYALVPADMPAGPVRVAERTPFIGREPERAQLRQLLDRAAGGHGGLVLIGGEPGIGKTRLATELAADATTRFRFGIGHCYESGRDVPYMPWVEMIEGAMRDTGPAELRESLGDDASELARLVPELRRLFPDIPAPVELPPEQQRRYTFNSVREYVTRASKTQPRLYVVEDLHWADEPTLLLLEHLAERLSELPCLVVGTYRDSPSDITPQLGATLSRLVRGRQGQVLSLARHSEGEITALLQALTAQPPPKAVVAAIYKETDGNAFFVEEVVRHLAEAEVLFDERGRFRTDVTIDELDVPANVRLVIDRRLDRLDDATRRAMAVAAVAGRHVGFELWEAVAELNDDVLIDAIDEAERAGIIVTETRDGRDEYWFAHELIRQTLLTRLPAARRRKHHLRVADALESLAGEDLQTQAGTIAAHLIAAGSIADPVRLFRFLVLAGGQALVSAAFEDALRHLRTAAALAQEAVPSEHAEMLLRLGLAERAAGEADAAVAAWTRAIELHQECGDAGAITQMCSMGAWSLLVGGRFMDALDLAERGLTALGSDVSAAGGRLLVVSGFCQALIGRYDEGMSSITRALQMADEVGDVILAGHALTWKSGIHHVHMEGRKAVESGSRAAELLRAAGQHWPLSIALATATFSSAGLAAFSGTHQRAAEGARVAERLGDHGASMMIGRGLAMANWAETGDIAVIETFSESDMRLCEKAGLPWISWSWSWRAAAAFHRGDWDAAIRHAAQAAALAPPGSINGAEWALHLEYSAYAGRRDDVLTMMETRRAELPRVGEPTGWGPWAMLWGFIESHIVLGDFNAAAELYPLIRWCAERTGNLILMQPDCRLLERGAGMAAAAGSHWDVAEAHLLTALEQAEKLPHRPEQANTRRHYGAMLLRRGGSGDADRAGQLLSEAEALYRAMGMPRHVELTRATPGQ
jgi:class 3 adenylate cyclase/tetratricopeptide (TPR) repeat protein